MDIENNVRQLCVSVTHEEEHQLFSKTRRFEKCGPELIRYVVYICVETNIIDLYLVERILNRVNLRPVEPVEHRF